LSPDALANGRTAIDASSEAPRYRRTIAALDDDDRCGKQADRRTPSLGAAPRRRPRGLLRQGTQRARNSAAVANRSDGSMASARSSTARSGA
jgi:hypothetical protein